MSLTLLAKAKSPGSVCATLRTGLAGVSASVVVSKNGAVYDDWDLCVYNVHGLSFEFPEPGDYQISITINGRCNPSPSDLYYLSFKHGFGLNVPFEAIGCVNRTVDFDCNVPGNPPDFDTLVTPGYKVPIASGIIKRLSLTVRALGIIPLVEVYKGDQLLHSATAPKYPYVVDFDAPCSADLPAISPLDLTTAVGAISAAVPIALLGEAAGCIMSSRSPLQPAMCLSLALVSLSAFQQMLLL